MLTQNSASRKDRRTAAHGVELQHRHFSFIAATIAGLALSEENRRGVANEFADECSQTNPRFDRARFMRACGF